MLPPLSSCRGLRLALVVLRHALGVTLSWEWLTQLREGEETELRQALEPYGSARVSGSGLLSEPRARFPPSTLREQFIRLVLWERTAPGLPWSIRAIQG
jgi:hypothetical protein